MPSSSSKTSRARAVRPSCPDLGGAANNGVNTLRKRTTCDISQAANRVVDVARCFLRIDGESASKGAFMDEAVGTLVLKLQAENPDFKLPKDLASLDFMPSMKPNKANGSNT